MKRFLLIFSIIGLFACEKDNPEPNTPPVIGNNGSDTTTHAPVRVENKLTCYIEGIYFEAEFNNISVVNDTIKLDCYKAQNVGSNIPYQDFKVEIKKGSTGNVPVLGTLGKYLFKLTERKVGAAGNVFFNPMQLNIYVYQNSNSKLEASFWGVVVDNLGTEYKIQSGKISFDIP